MRQPTTRFALPDRERLDAVERRIHAHEAALKGLEPMQTQLKEIHDMLIAGRAILWLLRRIVFWAGGPSAIAGVGYTAWRAFTGH